MTLLENTHTPIISGPVSPYMTFGSDPAAWALPPVVLDRLAALRQAADDARLLYNALFAEQQEARLTATRIKSRLNELQKPLGIGGYSLGDEHPSVIAERDKLDRVNTEIARINGLTDARLAISNSRSALRNAAESYLRDAVLQSGIDAITEYSAEPAPALRKNENISDAVERCRRRIRELRADRKAVESAPWHSSLAKERARREIEEAAERGRPSVVNMIDNPEAGIYWGARPATDISVAGRLITQWGDPIGFPTMAWLFKNEMISAIERMVDEVADDKNALGLEERADRIAVIDRDALAVERDEEALIEMASKQGQLIERRADADPRAVLHANGPAPVRN